MKTTPFIKKSTRLQASNFKVIGKEVVKMTLRFKPNGKAVYTPIKDCEDND